MRRRGTPPSAKRYCSDTEARTNGSRYQTGSQKTWAPAWAIVSCGEQNRFGFPDPDVVARWRAVGAEVVRTDRAGTITARVAADGAITLQTFDPVPLRRRTLPPIAPALSEAR